LDINLVSPALNGELNTIISECQTSHDYNIFLVTLAHPFYLEGHPHGDVKGLSFGQGKYGFVFVSSATTLAHELGHAHAGLQDTIPDEDNIMSYGGGSRWRLRKNQWDLCNPNEDN